MNEIQLRLYELLCTTTTSLIALDPAPKPDVKLACKNAIKLLDELSDVESVAAIAEGFAKADNRTSSAFARLYRGGKLDPRET